MKKKERKMKIYFKLEEPINGLSYSTLNSILDYMFQKWLYNADGDYLFVSIYSNEMKTIKSNYKEYITYLYNIGLIELNDHYSDGKQSEAFSKSFRFTDIFFNDIEIDRIDFRYNKLKEPLQNISTTIDRYVDDRLLKDYLELNADESKLLKSDCSTYMKYFNTYIKILKMKNNRSYNWGDKKRLYTEFTYCSSVPRSVCFNFDGERLADIDVPNSFPMFFTKWLISQGLDTNDYDNKQFIENVCAGRNKNDYSIFYLDLCDKLNRIKDSDGEDIFSSEFDIYTKTEKQRITYSKSKNIFMKFINGKNNNDYISNVFRQYYPDVYNILTNYKKENDIQHIYNELVELETTWIMNKLVKTLYQKIDGIKITTCHDQIYFQHRFMIQANEIYNVIIKELQDELLKNMNKSVELDIDFSDLGLETINYIKKEKKEKERWSDENKNKNIW